MPNYNIVLSSDENSYPGLLALLNSIVINSQSNISNLKVHILVYNKPEYLKSLLTSHQNTSKLNYNIRTLQDYPEYLTFLKSNMKVYGGKKFNYISNVMNFARFYIPDIWPSLKTALYLDTDMITNTSIAKLFDEYLPYLTSKTPLVSPLIMPLASMNFHPTLNMDPNILGFNAGIYLFDLSYWRTSNFTSRIQELMSKNLTTPLFKLGTQPLMNILYYGYIADMDRSWNYKGLGSSEYPMSRLLRANILHWSGPNKPWLPGGLNKDIWLKYRLATTLSDKN